MASSALASSVSSSVSGLGRIVCCFGVACSLCGCCDVVVGGGLGHDWSGAEPRQVSDEALAVEAVNRLVPGEHFLGEGDHGDGVELVVEGFGHGDPAAPGEDVDRVAVAADDGDVMAAFDFGASGLDVPWATSSELVLCVAWYLDADADGGE